MKRARNIQTGIAVWLMLLGILGLGGAALALTPATATPNPFSPNGDGVNDTTTISATASTTVDWWVYVRDGMNNTIAAWQGHSAAISVAWDGKNASGQIVPDGTYNYEVIANEPVGQAVATGSVTVDTTPPTLTNIMVDPAFSPNGDGVKDILPIAGDSPSPDATAMGADVLYRADHTLPPRVVASYFGTSGPGGWSVQATWDGRDAYTGNLLPNGYYDVVLWASDAAGNLATSVRRVRLDTVGPAIGSFTAPSFSPNGDNFADTTTISGSVSDTGAVASWTVQVRNAGGQIVRTGTGQGNSVSWVWDGRDQNGTVVPDGIYYIDVSATDDVGNTAAAGVASLKVRTIPPAINMVSAAKAFSPALAPAYYSMKVDWAGSARWEVSGPGGILASASLPLPRQWNQPAFQWRGTDAQGNALPTGTYTLTFRVYDSVWPTPTEVPVTVLLDRDAPAIANVQVAQVSTGRYHITASASDAGAGPLQWRVDILNPQGQVIASSGGWGNAIDAWYSRTAPSWLARYRPGYASGVAYRITATDGVGNQSQTSGTLP